MTFITRNKLSLTTLLIIRALLPGGLGSSRAKHAEPNATCKKVPNETIKI
ncbi:hypothetical protein FM107_09755 [Sphingobacterium sp. JB170]|nr:hypothetical protein FM107_09755 [Sphingobacterium sp. JB170]